MKTVAAAAALTLGAAFVSVGVAAPAQAFDICSALSGFPAAYQACLLSPMVGQCQYPPPELVDSCKMAKDSMEQVAANQQAADRAFKEKQDCIKEHGENAGC
jgi:hypothetical protein